MTDAEDAARWRYLRDIDLTKHNMPAIDAPITEWVRERIVAVRTIRFGSNDTMIESLATGPRLQALVDAERARK